MVEGLELRGLGFRIWGLGLSLEIRKEVDVRARRYLSGISCIVKIF
jgi:hypothetical protein